MRRMTVAPHLFDGVFHRLAALEFVPGLDAAARKFAFAPPSDSAIAPAASTASAGAPSALAYAMSHAIAMIVLL